MSTTPTHDNNPVVAFHQTQAVYTQLECNLWRAFGLANKAKNNRDGSRFYNTLITGAKMTTGVAPTNRNAYAAEWQRFLEASGLMLGQSAPPFTASISALHPTCNILQNYIEVNALESFTENAHLMSLVKI